MTMIDDNDMGFRDEITCIRIIYHKLQYITIIDNNTNKSHQNYT